MAILGSRLFLKMMGSYVLLLLTVLSMVDVWMAHRIHEDSVKREESRLRTAALILSETVPDTADIELLQHWAERQGARSGLRITVIEGQGRVLADNQFNPAQMDN